MYTLLYTYADTDSNPLVRLINIMPHATAPTCFLIGRAVQCFIVKTSPIVFFVDRLALSLNFPISHSRHRQAAAAVAYTI